MVLNIELLRWMWLLGWISGHIWKYKIWIVEMCLNIVVTLIDEKMRESCLRCFGHIQRRTINPLVRKGELIQVEGMKEKVEDDKK